MAEESFLGIRYSTPLNVTIDQKQFSTETENYDRQTINLGFERYRIDVTFELDGFGELMAASKLRRHRQKHGLGSRFTMAMPQDLGVGDAPSVDVTVRGTVDKGDDTVQMITGDRTVQIPVGRFITFSGHKKVYVIESFSYRPFQVYGDAVIQPNLQKNIANGELVNFTPDITVRYALDGTASFGYTRGAMSKLSMSVVEDINAP